MTSKGEHERKIEAGLRARPMTARGVAQLLQVSERYADLLLSNMQSAGTVEKKRVPCDQCGTLKTFWLLSAPPPGRWSEALQRLTEEHADDVPAEEFEARTANG